jgi:hypothetical protein
VYGPGVIGRDREEGEFTRPPHKNLSAFKEDDGRKGTRGNRRRSAGRKPCLGNGRRREKGAAKPQDGKMSLRAHRGSALTLVSP